MRNILKKGEHTSVILRPETQVYMLFRDEKRGSPRYASEKWLTELGRVNAERQMRLAGHLCATHVDELLRGDTSFVSKLHQEV